MCDFELIFKDSQQTGAEKVLDDGIVYFPISSFGEPHQEMAKSTRDYCSIKDESEHPARIESESAADYVIDTGLAAQYYEFGETIVIQPLSLTIGFPGEEIANPIMISVTDFEGHEIRVLVAESMGGDEPVWCTNCRSKHRVGSHQSDGKHVEVEMEDSAALS